MSSPSSQTPPQDSLSAKVNAREGVVKVPEILLAFWVIKLLTTAMGEASSDFLIHLLDPIVAVLLAFVVFVAALVIQFRIRTYNPWAYWFAVVMVSVFGTMVADVAHVGVGIPYGVSTLVFAVALAAILWWWKGSEKTLSIHSVNSPRREVFYWLTVLATFALGTAGGDWTAHTLGWGFLLSGIIFLGVMAIPVIGFRWLKCNEALAFWFAYIATRPVGASFADWIGANSARGGLNFGFGNIALLLTAGIVLLVWRESRLMKKLT